MSVEREGNGTVLCKWVIENFTFALDQIELSSPKFTSSFLDVDLFWVLNIYLKEDFLKNGFRCCLIREFEDHNHDLDDKVMNCEISILNGDGFYRQIFLKTNVLQWEMVNGLEVDDDSDLGLVYGRNIMGLLKENTLTICCRIWGEEVFKPIEWLLRTRIGTQKRTFKKSLHRDSAYRKDLVYTIYDDFGLLVEFNWIDDGQILQIQINQYRPEIKQQVACVVSVLDSTGNSILSQRDTFRFSDERTLTWNFPPFISKKWLSDNEDRCIINNAFNLWVECEISTSHTTGEVEKLHFGDFSASFAEEMDYAVGPIGDSTTANTATSSLVNGLLSLYQEQRFCDVTIQTWRSSFPVHKAILCAQSPVFTAMFERDFEEKRTGVVNISDIADDTVRQMLKFLYSGTVEDLDWDSAVQLFLASEKYGIVSLKLICNNLMTAKLSVANVTKALLLVDLHNDDAWKSDVLRFILDKDSEVMNSDMWKEFIQSHTKLAAEAMHRIYLQKLNK